MQIIHAYQAQTLCKTSSDLHCWIDIAALPSQPESISHLLGYRHLIVEVHLYSGEARDICDHHLCHTASTRLPNFNYLLPLWHRRIVINKICSWQVANTSSTTSTYLASPNHKQCSGPQIPPRSLQEENSTYTWLYKSKKFLGNGASRSVFVLPGCEFISACLTLLQQLTLRGYQPPIHWFSKNGNP